MPKHYASLPGGLTACFNTACDLRSEPAVRLQLSAYIPGLTFLDTRLPATDLTLTHKITGKDSLTHRGSHLTITSATADKFPADLYHLFYSAVRGALLERGFYSVHAACVGKGDDFILIAGHSGAGKTSLAHNLVNDHGYRLFSGNKTIVRIENDGTIKAVAGTRTMTALDQNQNRYAYELAPAQYADAPEVTIKAITLIRLNDGVAEHQTLSAASALHSLYPFFLDSVNADVITAGAHVFNGAASSVAKGRLARDLGNALKTLPVYKTTGSMNHLEYKALRS